IAFHHLTGRRIEGDLAAKKSQAVVHDRLGIGPDRLGRVIGRNSLFHSSSPVFQNEAFGSTLARSRSFPAAGTRPIHGPRAAATLGPRTWPFLLPLRSSPRSGTRPHPRRWRCLLTRSPECAPPAPPRIPAAARSA